jgi:hypothetical protein
MNYNYSQNGFENYTSPTNNRADECSICLKRFTTREPVIRTSRCGHLFHYNCLSKWSGTGRNSCPLCRQNGVKENVNVIRNKKKNLVQLAVKRRFATENHTKALTIQSQLSRYNLAFPRGHNFASPKQVNALRHILEERVADLQKNLNGVSYNDFVGQINNMAENARAVLARYEHINQNEEARNIRIKANAAEIANLTQKRNAQKAARENRNTKAAESYKRARDVRNPTGAVRKPRDPINRIRASPQAAAQLPRGRTRPPTAQASAQASTRPPTAQLPRGRTRPRQASRPAYRP